MRGEATMASAMDVRTAMLWLDLRSAGVSAEVGEVPFSWFGPEKKLEAAASPAGVPAVSPAPVAEVVLPEVKVSPIMPRAEKTEVAAASARPVAAPVEKDAGRIWCEGTGAVAVVLEGECVLQGRARELFNRMLASVGISAGEVAWVGFTGTVEAAALVQAVAACGAGRVLVLGQNPLAAVLGKKLGVEGWQASPSRVSGWGAMGVTYPPTLLLAQPLFKRLAWQHLLAWKQSWEA